MPALRSKDIAQMEDDKVIASSKKFSVNWFLGRPDHTYKTLIVEREEMWVRKEFDTLEEARAAVEAAGTDAQTRRGMIYAIGDRDLTVFVDRDYEKRSRPFRRPER